MSAPAAPIRRYRSRSLWLDRLPDLRVRPALGGDDDAEVVIVGAGFTGLWCAYHLLEAAPRRRVLVLEAETVGFGASGRNGGWCSALFPLSWPRVARLHGTAAARGLYAALRDAVAEVGAVCRREGIDAGYHRGGTLTLARTPGQRDRIRAGLAADAELGLDTGTWLEPPAVEERVRVPGVLGAAFTPHCARVNPAALVRGLAAAVERRGGVIHDRSPVREVSPGRVRTPVATVRAEHVVLATEAYTARFRELHRRVIPVWSLMVATEPLPERFFAEVGWDGRETLTDGRHLVIYAQRTSDDRIAFGGRGAPYHFGSRIRDAYDRHAPTFASLRSALTDLFPALGEARTTHAWGGPLGVPRDWHPSVGYAPTTRIGWARGYVGDGVAAAAMAGATLADLVDGRDTERTRLCWVRHRSPDWEPEPLRWLGVNLAARAAATLDHAEARNRDLPRLRRRLGGLTGA